MKRAIPILFLLLVVTSAEAQRLPSGEEVLRRIQKGTEGVEDYIVDLLIDVNMERIRIPRAKAKMYFKKPDKVHFDSPSIAMLPREGMAFNSASVLAQYTAETIGPDTANGKKVIKLQLAAKEATARLRQLFAWVDPDTWTVTRIQTIPYEGRLLSMDFTYEFHENKYWMPASLTARFDVLNDAGAKRPEQPAAAPETPLDQMQQRAPRSGSLSIGYSSYKINSGLSDEIFEPKGEKQ